MAELTAILVTADVTGRLSTQAYARLFAKNGGATVDTTFRDLCIAQANSKFRILTRAAFPDGFYQTTDTPDPGVVGLIFDLCCGLASYAHPAANDLAGYGANAARAEAMILRINRDADARPPGSAAGRSRPRSSVTNLTDSAGAYTNPLSRAADGKDGSGF